VPDSSTWIGPAVVAACVSGVIAVVGFFVSTWTARTLHRERLNTDLKLAERKIEADIALADRRLSADLALTEKKIALDRATSAWQRKTTFAEEILSDFYEAREIINAARSPASFGDEGATREKAPWESESDTRQLNSLYAPAERLLNKGEFFSKLLAHRYRFLALFGLEMAKPHDELYKIRGEIFIAVRMLIMTYEQRQSGSLPDDRREWQRVIWEMSEEDPIRARLDQVVEAIEAICRPVIQEVAQ
jgi:hypothetical protein